VWSTSELTVKVVHDEPTLTDDVDHFAVLGVETY